MRNQIRSVSCDYVDEFCDEEFEQDGFIAAEPRDEVTWPMLESAAREEGWTCKHGRHLCPAHSDHQLW